MKPKSTTPTSAHLLHPRHWPSWLGLGLLWLTVKLPYPVLLRLGGALGNLLYHLVRRRRHIAETNIRLAFPELDPQQQTELVKAHFRASGIAFLEIGLSWWGDEKRLKQLSHINGLEHVQHALAQGHGVILLSGHFVCLIITGRLLAQELAFNIVTKKSHSAVFEALMRRHRLQHYQGLVDSTEMRSMIKALKNNQVLWYAPDQDFRHRGSAVFVPFMGVQTATLTTTARLAKTSKAPVIYTEFERLPGTQGYQVTLHPPMENFPCGDDIEDAHRVNEVIEQQVRKVPEQYLWTHRRFKTRPEGEPGVYGKAGK